ncbi:putative transcriptional regulator [Carbonactinospora thermoautotrophica]|uniref:Putative transcriptional regulator n=3 Tax=Carbonactinospora thermoautotrophica TaxID=1469144 RepID=A0A132MRA1_9ACTN|nr:putative transcriptional regulator [Carbonactinospora thermoautotrophica]
MGRHELRDNGVVKNVRERQKPGPVPLVMDPVDAHPVDGQHGTRHRVARAILENGPSTAAALAELLDLTPAAVRKHLDALLAEGLVEARGQRVHGHRGRGRPARVFALTDAGRGVFYQAYDELAIEALRFLARIAGEGAVRRFAESRLDELERKYRPLLERAPLAERPKVLARALTADGYVATARTAPATGGAQVCQHHCPVAHVAERFPQLCEAETEVFARLLGTHVQRLATIAHGDGVCTTYVPAVADKAASPTSPVSLGRQGSRESNEPGPPRPVKIPTDTANNPTPAFGRT